MKMNLVEACIADVLVGYYYKVRGSYLAKNFAIVWLKRLEEPKLHMGILLGPNLGTIRTCGLGAFNLDGKNLFSDLSATVVPYMNLNPEPEEPGSVGHVLIQHNIQPTMSQIFTIIGYEYPFNEARRYDYTLSILPKTSNPNERYVTVIGIATNLSEMRKLIVMQPYIRKMLDVLIILERPNLVSNVADVRFYIVNLLIEAVRIDREIYLSNIHKF